MSRLPFGRLHFYTMVEWLSGATFASWILFNAIQRCSATRLAAFTLSLALSQHLPLPPTGPTGGVLFEEDGLVHLLSISAPALQSLPLASGRGDRISSLRSIDFLLPASLIRVLPVWLTPIIAYASPYLTHALTNQLVYSARGLSPQTQQQPWAASAFRLGYYPSRDS